MKRQTIALFLAILMVASAFTAVELTAGTTTASAHTATQLTLTVSKPNPAIGENVTFTATLKRASGTSYVPLSGKWVRIGYYDANNVWHQDCSRLSDANGKITYERFWTSAGAKTRYAWFPGDTTYATSKSGAVTVTVRQGVTSSLSFNQPPLTLHANQWTDFYGYLKDDAGRGVPGKSIDLYMRGPGATTYTKYGTVTTDKTGSTIGRWHARFAGNGPGIFYFYAKYAGDAGYKPSQSKTWGIAVDTPVPVGISLKMPATAAVNQNFDITGRLTDMNGQPVVGVPIKLEYRMGSSGSYSYYGTVNTDSNGYYHAIGGANAPTTFYIKASFAGNSVYGANAGFSAHTTIS